MQGYNTTVTPVVTGILTVSSPFPPKYVRVMVSSQNLSDNYMHFSEGAGDNTYWATVHSMFMDTSGGKTARNAGTNGKIIGVFERVSGTITEVNAATLDSFVTTGSYAVKLNVTNCTHPYQYNIEILG